jgi:peptidoglycan hydrolase-like protein with peptidoglycan-binding domain
VIFSARLRALAMVHPVFQRGSFTVSVFKTSFALILTAAVLSPSAFASRVHRAPTSGQTRTTHKLSASRKSHKVHGQQSIDPERVTQIQQALIRQHYMTGEATGKWDASTAAAMQKFQGDQGWQTKLTPDSRALVKLGLGPDYSSAINAKDSSFAAPPAASSIPQEQASGFAAAAGVNQ